MTTIEVHELTGVLNELAASLANDSFAEAFQRSKQAIGANFIEIFADQQSASGGVWPEHSPMTVFLHGPHPLLILTGAMYSSVVNEGSAGHYQMTGDREMEWGTNIGYAVKQNYGGPNDNGTYTPAREFMYWTETAANAVLEVISQRVDSHILAEAVAA